MTEQTGNNKPNEAEGLAFPLSGNEKLIEEAKHLIEQAGSFREQVGDDASPTSMIGLWLRTADALHAALAVFEKALTPTDDEVEALRIAHLDARQAAYRKEREDWFVDHEAEPEIATNAFFRGWDAAVGGGFRRSEVPEPSAECPQCHRPDGLHKLGCGERFREIEKNRDAALVGKKMTVVPDGSGRPGHYKTAWIDDPEPEGEK